METTLLNAELIKDKPSLIRIQSAHPCIRQRAIDAYLLAESRMSGMNRLRITYGLRTFKEQQAIWQKGRDEHGNVISGRSIVTKAKAGQSYHNYGLALDFVLLHNDGKISYSLSEDLDNDGEPDWKEVAYAFKKFGFNWGGEWKFRDNPHVEFIPEDVLKAASARRPPVRPWQILLEMHNSDRVDQHGYVLIGGVNA